MMPTPFDHKLELGWACFQRGDYQRALSYAHQILQDAPEYPPAHYLGGFTALASEDGVAAQEFSDTLLELAPEEPQAHQLAGLVAHQVEKRERAAEEHLVHAVRLAPEVPEFRASLAGFLAGRDRLEEGITVARKGLKFEPENRHLLETLQMLYRVNGEPELAQEMGQRALQASPEEGGNHLEAGLRFLEQRRTRVARGHFLEALRLQPADGQTKEAMAHERVRTHPFFRDGFYLSFEPRILVPALLVPLIWYGLSLVFSLFLYLCWASILVLGLLYGYHGLFLLCRWYLRRRIEGGHA